MFGAKSNNNSGLAFGNSNSGNTGFGNTNTGFGANSNSGNSGGFSFGQQNNQSSGSASAGGFGQTNAKPGFSFGALNTGASNTGGAAGNKPGFSFGGSNTNTGNSGGLFGSNNNASSNASGGLFGAKSTAGGLFGNSNSATTNTGATATAGGLFGGGSANNNTSGGLFGNNNSSNNNASGGLFGSNNNNNNNNNNSSGGGLFGNSNNNNTSSGGLFGSNNASNNAASTSGGLFGNSNTNNNSSSGGLFGNNANNSASNNSNTNSGGLFGNNANNNTSGGLFGNNNANNNNNNTSGGLFGNNNASSLAGLTATNNQPSFAWTQNTQNKTFQSSHPTINALQLQHQLQLQQKDLNNHSNTIIEQLVKIANSWDPASTSLTTYFYNKVPENEVLGYSKPDNVSQEEWNKAVSERPDSNFVPVKATGFDDLKKRSIAQTNHIAQSRLILKEIETKCKTLSEKHELDSKTRINSCLQKYEALSKKLLMLGCKLSVLKSRGFPLNSQEEALAGNFDMLLKSVNDPDKLGRSGELWSRLTILKERSELLNGQVNNKLYINNGEAEDDVENDAQIDKMVKVLQQEQVGIQYLAEVLEKDKVLMDKLLAKKGKLPAKK